MTKFKRCVFDPSGRAIQWLIDSGIVKNYSTYEKCCWICTMLANDSAKQEAIHTGCCAREETSHSIPEIWLVHDDDHHRQWNEIVNASIKYSPAAILFVSALGSSQEFGGKEPDVLKLSTPKDTPTPYLPIFYLNSGLYGSSDTVEFEEMLRCFEIALESPAWCSKEEVLDSFGRAALISSNSHWPFAIRLRDDAESLFYLWCAVRLRAHCPNVPQYTMAATQLLMWRELSLAHRHGEPLEAMLAKIHADAFIPLDCRADVMQRLRPPDNVIEPKLAKEIVDGWLHRHEQFSAKLGIKEGWAQIREWIYADLGKWPIDVRQAKSGD